MWSSFDELDEVGVEYGGGCDDKFVLECFEGCEVGFEV